MARRENSEINAGSMADIAFLLLIFFLVTTTMDVDSGISRKLSEKPPENYEPPVIKQKNILEININRNDELLVEDERMEIADLKQTTIDFLDNGGGIGKTVEGVPTGACDYCNGEKSDKSSDHPNKAIISVQSDRGTSYGMYITVQNELLAAYTELRNRYAKTQLKGQYAGMSYDDLILLSGNDKENKALKAVINKVKDAYPQIISDAEPTK
ncbi:ExbD/TolR family protein [Flavicella sediminum]|uniref:ExbD/TolR family protein n=1 Tax=Flavicella sediminum TaxID=2585141 RepID=UPI001120987E|nr:biopolymer transporter ExbD [Flavicella sediminum]